MKRGLLFSLLIAYNLFSQKINHFRDGVVSAESWYGIDKVIDSVHTYYKNGKPNEFIFFDLEGKIHGRNFRLNQNGDVVCVWEYEHGLFVREDILFDKNLFYKGKLEFYTDKLESLTHKIHQNPYNPQYTLERCDINITLGNFYIAHVELLKIEKDLLRLPYNPSIKNNILGVLYDLKRMTYNAYEEYNLAITAGLKAIRYAPKNASYYYNLSTCLYYLKEYKLCEYYIHKALEINPHHAFSNRMLAFIYTDLGEYKKAMKYLTRAKLHKSKLSKYSAENTERNLTTLYGFLSHKLGNSQKGIKELNTALRNNPKNTYALRDLGEVYYDLKDLDNACRYFHEANDLGYVKTYDSRETMFYEKRACKNKWEPYRLKKQGFFLSPNPAHKSFSISQCKFGKYTYKITNHKNKTVDIDIKNDSVFDVSDLHAGLYTLKMYHQGRETSFKFIKE